MAHPAGKFGSPAGPNETGNTGHQAFLQAGVTTFPPTPRASIIFMLQAPVGQARPAGFDTKKRSPGAIKGRVRQKMRLYKKFRFHPAPGGPLYPWAPESPMLANRCSTLSDIRALSRARAAKDCPLSSNCAPLDSCLDEHEEFMRRTITISTSSSFTGPGPRYASHRREDPRTGTYSRLPADRRGSAPVGSGLVQGTQDRVLKYFPARPPTHEDRQRQGEGQG